MSEYLRAGMTRKRYSYLSFKQGICLGHYLIIQNIQDIQNNQKIFK